MSVQALPKAELHMHIDGAIEVSVAYDVVKKACPERLDELFRTNADNVLEYNYDDFIGFLNCIDTVAPLALQTPVDYEALTYGYLKNAASEGLVYCEMIVCPGMWHTSADYDFADMMAAFKSGIDRAEQDFGVYARCKATLERGASPEAVDKNWWAVKQIVENSDNPYLVGLDLANYEQLGDIPGHQELFDYIAEHQKKELHISMHAGENAGPQNIIDAMAAGAKRGGHITCIMDDPELVKKVIAAKFHGEICLSSNAFSKAVPTLEAHRITEIYNAGVRISLNTDDPTFFRTTIGQEYQIAQDVFGLTDLQLIDITMMAIEDSFADDALKAACIESVYNKIEGAYNFSRADITKHRGSGQKQDQPAMLKSA
jgi:adenosine deaminase